MSEFTIGFPSDLPGIISDANTERNGVRIRTGVLSQHVTIAGSSGSGKSVAIKRIVEAANRQGISVLTVDLLGDLAGVAEPRTDTPGFKRVVADRNLPVGEPAGLETTIWTLSGPGAPFRMPIGQLSPTMVAGLLMAYSAPQQTCIDALWRYKAHDMVTVDDLIVELRRASIYGVGSIKPAARTCEVLQARAESLRDRIGTLFGPATFNFEADIVDSGRVNIIDGRAFNDTDMRTALTGFVGTLLEMTKDLPPSDAVRLMVVIDEAASLFVAESTQRRATIKSLLDTYADAFRQARKKGVSIVVGSQSYADFPDFVKDNARTNIVMRMPGSKITPKTVKSLIGGDMDKQTVEQALRSLDTGQAVIAHEGGSHAIDVVPPGVNIDAAPTDLDQTLEDSTKWWEDNATVDLFDSRLDNRSLVG